MKIPSAVFAAFAFAHLAQAQGPALVCEVSQQRDFPSTSDPDISFERRSIKMPGTLRGIELSASTHLNLESGWSGADYQYTVALNWGNEAHLFLRDNKTGERTSFHGSVNLSKPGDSLVIGFDTTWTNLECRIEKELPAALIPGPCTDPDDCDH